MRTEAESWAFGVTMTDEPDNTDLVKHALTLAKLYQTEQGTTMGTFLFMSCFLGHVMARWPDQIETWTNEYLEQAGTNRKTRGMWYMALALSPEPRGAQVLEAVEPLHDKDGEEIAAALALKTMDVRKLIPGEPYHLDMLWGSFFGCGDYRLLLTACAPILLAMDDTAGVAQSQLGRRAYQQLKMYTVANHPGVLRAMSRVYEEIPELDNAIVDIELALDEAWVDPHTSRH
jgi:hypothetical protein